MAASTSQLKPLSVSPRLHRKTKLIATLEDKELHQVAEELYWPIAEKKADQLLQQAANKNGGGRK